MTGAGGSRATLAYPLPPDSAAAFLAHRQRAPQNPGLLFDRFPPDWGSAPARQRGEVKRQGLAEVVQAARLIDTRLYQAWQARWQALVQAAGAAPFVLRTDWRLVAGLGRKGALEVGFTFNRYGFPVLPGSTVKGVARAWGLLAVAQEAGAPDLQMLDRLLDGAEPRGQEPDGAAAAEPGAEDEDRHFRRHFVRAFPQAAPTALELAEQFRAIFGTRQAAGRAVFFEAVPAEPPQLQLDLMNPHYPAYYAGDEPPANWQSPVPVPFLTVAPNTPFRFAVGWRGPSDEASAALRALAQRWLIQGLVELGAGAKTSAGYGYFVEPASPGRDDGATAPAVAAAAPTEPLLTWRTGTVREYQPERGRGRLVDDESGEIFSFRREAIEDKGWSPARRARVEYALAELEGRWSVVRLRRRG